MSAAEIRLLRRSLLLTQYELSNLVGVTRHTIVRWEGGRVVPHLRHMRRLEELGSALERKLRDRDEASFLAGGLPNA